MDLKEGFIHHLEALIKEGETILQSKGIRQKSDTRNLAGQLSGITLSADSDHKMKQERFDRLKRSGHWMFDHNYSSKWIGNIHGCFLEYRGEASPLTKYIKVYIGRSKIEKTDVEQILSFLRNTKTSEKT